jgi:hypothetical protein
MKRRRFKQSLSLTDLRCTQMRYARGLPCCRPASIGTSYSRRPAKRTLPPISCGRQHVAPRASRILRQPADHRQITAGFVPRRYIDHRYLRCAHRAVTRVSAVIGIVRSTTSAPRAINRQTTARPASRDAGSTSTNWSKLVAWPRANPIARSASTASTGAFLSGSNRFAASSRALRMPRSVAILNRAPLLLAIQPADQHGI